MTRPLTITALGNAQISTAQSKFGGTSASLDGTGDYLNIDSTSELAFGTGDFCMEAWIYKTGGTSYHTIFDMRTNGSDGGGIILGINNVNQIYMYYNFGYRITTAAISNNAWTHVALARVSGETRVFINGTQSGSTYTDTNNYAQRGLHIGGDPAGNYNFPGYVDEIRISKGAGRYSGTFSVATQPFNNDSSTSLLIHAFGSNASTNFYDDIAIQTDSDSLYIYDSYFETDGYYVYQAEAASAISTTASVSAQVGVIRSAASAMSVTTTVVASLANIQGADLFAFSNAALAADVQRIRDYNIATSSQFSVAVDAVRGIYVSAQADAQAALSADFLRARTGEAALSAAFSLTIPAEKIVSANLTITSVFNVTADNSRTLTAQSNIFANVTLSATARRISDVTSGTGESSAAWEVIASLTAAISVIRPAGSSIASQASLSATISHIEGADLVAFTNAELTAAVERIRPYELAASSAFSVAIDAVRSVYVVAQADSVSTVSADILRVRLAEAATVAAFSVSADSEASITATADLTATASLSASAFRTSDVVSTPTATTTLTASADRTRDVVSTQSATATVAVEGGLVQSAQISTSATTTVTVTGFITNKRPRQTTAFNGITTTTADKILGTHSLYKDASNKYLEVAASQDFNIGSGVDFAISFYFKPTTGTGKILRAYDPAAAREVWSFSNNSTSARFSYWTGSTTLNIDISRTVVNWSFFGVTRTGSNLTFVFENGVGASGSQTVTLAGAISSGTPVIQVGIPSTSALGYFDEFAMAKGTSTYVPTTGGKNDTTQFLFHFDGNFTDDMTGTAFAQANLTTAATLTAQAIVAKTASSSLTANSQVTASLTGTQNAVINISALAFQTSVVGRLQSDVADLDSAFTLIAVVGKQQSAEAVLSSQTTLTASAVDLDLTSVSMSSNFALTAVVREIPVDRFDAITRSLLHFDQNKIDAVTNEPADGTVTFYGTSQTGFGYSAQGDGDGSDGPLILVTRTSGVYSTDASTEDFSYDVRLHPWNSLPTNDPNVETKGKIFTLQDEDLTSPLGGQKFYNLRYATPTATTLRIYVSFSYSDYSGGNLMTATVTSLTDSSEISFRQWHHIKIIRKSGILYLYIDGILQNSTSFNYNVIPSIVIGSSNFLGSLDESHWRIGSRIGEIQDFTVPTAPYSVLAGYIKQGVSDTSSSSSLSAIGYRAKFAESSVASQFAISIDNLRVRFGDSSISSEFVQTTIGQKNAILDSNQSSEFVLTTSAVRTRNLDTAVSVAATTIVDAVSVLVADSALSVASSLTVDARRFRGVDSSQNAQATQTTDAVKTAQASASFDVIATKLAASVKVGQGFINDIVVSATMSTTAQIIAYSQTDMTVVATSDFTVTRAAFAGASLSSTATMAIAPAYLRRNESIQTATSTLTVQGIRVGVGVSSMSVTATMTTATDNSRIRTTSVAVNSTATQTVSGDRFRLGQANLNSSTEMFATVYALVRFEVHISALAFEVTAGRVIHLDPLNGLKIPAETRTLTIESETRSLEIAAETRVNKIKGYPTL